MKMKLAKYDQLKYDKKEDEKLSAVLKISKILQTGKLVRILKALKQFASVLKMNLVVGYSGMENMPEAVPS